MRDAGVDEATRWVVDKSRIKGRVAIKRTVRIRRILAEHVITSEGEGGIVQQVFPARHRIIRSLASFDSLTVLAANHFLAVL